MEENPFQRQEFCVNLKEDPSTEVILITHGPPLHADDLLSIDMIAKEATKKWCEKNVNSAGVIELDIPGSKFDDKNLCAGSKKEAMCVKVARSLGILDDPHWGKLVEYINRDDLKAGSDQTSIVSLLKQGQQQNPFKFMDFCRWFMQVLAAKAELDNGNKNFTLPHVSQLLLHKASQLDFFPETIIKFGKEIRCRHHQYFKKAESELRQKSKKGEVIRKVAKDEEGNQTIIAAIFSINYRMQAVMRAEREDGTRFADVVIIKSPGGVLINHAKNVKVNMEEVAAVLRFMEAKKNNLPAENYWRDLRRPGTVGFAPAWFFNTASDPQMIMNSLSHDAPPSSLSLAEIAQCAVIALDEKSFHPRPDIAKICQGGTCPLGAKCPNLQMRLPRCIKNFMKGGKE